MELSESNNFNLLKQKHFPYYWSNKDFLGVIFFESWHCHLCMECHQKYHLQLGLELERRYWGTIVLSKEQTERWRTIQSFWKKNKRIERVLKNVVTICKGMKKNGNVLKERLKSGTSSYYQERVLSRERILNQECALNHLEIIERFFLYLITLAFFD